MNIFNQGKSQRTGLCSNHVRTTYFTATPDGAYRAAIEVSEVGAQRYIDKSWRVR